MPHARRTHGSKSDGVASACEIPTEPIECTWMNDFLIYGANGYTGSLIARLAIGQGLRPILAGRNHAAVEGLARELGLAHRLFDLDDPSVLDKGLQGLAAVLHCAGPFI